MKIRIVEIAARSEQGVTRPFLCRGDDGWLYYVKGNGAGRRALISEWIAGQLARRFGLPIPDFKQAIIPDELVRMSARDDIAELGAGIGFASQVVANADELTYLYVGLIENTLRAKVLLFDMWTANGDRTLTELGGNPNILWIHRDQKPYVIDHNLAFDGAGLTTFWAQHVFASSRTAWNSTFRAEMEEVMRSALGDLDEWWAGMPEEWTEVDVGMTAESVKTLLWRFETNRTSFWEAV